MLLQGPPLRAALYARVSTLDKGQDPETQMLKLRTWAVVRGYEIAGEYVDYASGKDDNRPQFQKMIEDARKRKFSLVIVVRLDRMMRSLTNMLKVLETFDRYHIMIECTDQALDTTTANGRLMIQMTAAFAEWEREIIRERVNDGIARAKAQGIKCGRPRLPDGAASPDALRMRAYRERRANKTTPSPVYIEEGGKSPIE